VDVTPDGSPLAVYRRLQDTGEAALVHAVIPAEASVLDLGCGTGRIARGLIALGHRVTGVDESEEMLAALPAGVLRVPADITTLRLKRRFGAVLLASHFVNDDPLRRASYLTTSRVHLASGGRLVGEAYPPGFDWMATVGRTTRLGEVEVTVQRADVRGVEVDAVVVYVVDGMNWRQPFRAWMLDEEELSHSLAVAGLAFAGWLERPGWFVADVVDD
jgi:SAM-dependent methyltransferase